MPLPLPCPLLLVLAGCGERKETLGPSGARNLELMLDWVPNADHAGIYAADGRGFFKANDLDVKIRVPGDPSTPLKQVAAGRVDLAISYEPEVLRARDQGIDVVAVGARRPAAADERPLAAAGHGRQGGGSEGQDRRDRRNRLPGRVP